MQEETQEPKEQLGYDAMEALLLGLDPSADGTEEEATAMQDITKDWAPEERAKVAELLKQLTPPEPQPEADLRESFKKGTTFRDPDGIRMTIRSVGKEAMNISVLGKKGRFIDGNAITLSGFMFVTHNSHKRNTTLLLRGINKVVEVPDAEA